MGFQSNYFFLVEIVDKEKRKIYLGNFKVIKE